MYSTLNLLTQDSSSFNPLDLLFSKWAILVYIALVVLIVIAIVVIAIRKDASSPKIVHNIELPNDVAVKAEGVSPARKGKSGQDEDDGEDRSRFYMLSELDANRGRFFKNDYNDGITLKILCDEFRAFACSKLRLYYSIDDIRKFIAGMSVSKIVILQGMSGTGKTSLAYAMGEFIGNPSTVIPVQPMWKERTDLVGYYNEFTKRFNETTLLQKMYEANYNKDIYVTILDEMNIARVEYYFAEFLSLLEIPNPDRRYLDVVTDEWDNDPIQFKGGQMKLPNNMWFVGTANNDDSTFAISDKVYDRAMIMNLDHKCEPFKAPKSKGIRVSAEKFFELTADAIKEYSITVRNAKRLEKLDEYMIKVFNITFGNRIMKQINTYIPVYVACGGEELEALDDILSKKVLRKLETQNPVYIRSAVDGFCDYLDELFGQDKMKLCKEYVQRIKKNV
ncbi:MAG: AAA family ATPase [Clostridia bacterium]|nr:AAA family ATPase [Clostridia bacterium]